MKTGLINSKQEVWFQSQKKKVKKKAKKKINNPQNKLPQTATLPQRSLLSLFLPFATICFSKGSNCFLIQMQNQHNIPSGC